MNPYDRYVLPYLIDLACGIGPIQKERAKLVPRALGRVLEIGIGTGRNLPFYDRERLSALYGLDPAAQMHRLARKRAAEAGIGIELLDLPAERIPSDDASFDTVVTTFTLCTIPDAVAALREMRRALRPQGQLLFCEHGLAPDAGVRRWQNGLTPVWKPLAGGCHLNRDIPALLAAGGFEITELQADYLPGPRPMTYVYRGVAVPET
ncbi:class I SAM-dependent methyltransferase [Solimonas variicoloris]|uniref:class I SAM-dependent methyltransferase n=1 Tax=Solimonas variicoloris TaxID=254408 RepID=UPI00036D80E1|nr:class I SAM-dependent methyltransferase [Solimonas variicoloris]